MAAERTLVVTMLAGGHARIPEAYQFTIRDGGALLVSDAHGFNIAAFGPHAWSYASWETPQDGG